MTKHVITHVELATTDTSATAAFYRALFGWDVQTYQPMDYVMANLGEGQTSIGFPIVNEYMKRAIRLSMSTRMILTIRWRKRPN